MQLPTEQQIRDRAVADGLVEDGAPVPSGVRAQVTQTLLDEAHQAAQPPAPVEVPGRVLSTSTLHTGDGGYIKVTVTHHPAVEGEPRA